MAGKVPSKSRKKKPVAAKNRTKPNKSVKSRPLKKAASSDRSPVYILAIMILLTVIAFMLIRNYKTTEKKPGKSENKIVDAIASKSTDIEKENEKNYKNIKKESPKESDKEDNLTDKNNRQIISDNKYEDRKEFYIYLLKFDSKSEKISVLPVRRQISTDSPLQSSLKELIKGPDRSEKRKGLLSAIPDDLKIRNIKVAGRTVVLDVNDAIESNANGEILINRIDQLVYTATQFDGIDGVVIKVNGKEKRFLGGEGLSISGPIRRRGK